MSNLEGCVELSLGKRPPLQFRVDTPEAVLMQAAAVAGRTNALAYVVTANLDHILSLAQDRGFFAAYNRAAARTLDGMPLVWAARKCSNRTVNRITGHDLLKCLLRPRNAERIFLLCSTTEVGELFTRAAQRLGRCPEDLAFIAPPHGFERRPVQTEVIIDAILQHRATHLVLGVGAPKSEVWCYANANKLTGIVAICVGDAVNVFAGATKRAPVFLQRAGLEWLFRLMHDPKRLARRYLLRSWVGLFVLAQTSISSSPQAPVGSIGRSTP
jgi:N-acetylglucosaminyldiphosphoundecaprenol N-acetyl-beta-D-mannosaminyltransferase